MVVGRTVEWDMLKWVMVKHDITAVEVTMLHRFILIAKNLSALLHQLKPFYNTKSQCAPRGGVCCPS